VILGIAASLITLGVTSSAKHTADPVVQEQAVAIADAYLQEILQKGFCDPDDTSFGIVGGLSHCRPNPSWAGCTASICGGTCGGNGANSLTPEASRTSYDDICDYNGLSQSPRDQNDTPLPGLSLYTATIAVVGDATAIVGALVGTNGQTARVDVTVSHPALPAPVVVSGYRVNY
jgi:MSHA pilin protein MshD